MFKKAIFYLLAIMLSASYLSANGNQTEDYNIVSGLFKNQLLDSALPYSIEFMQDYPTSSHLPEILKKLQLFYPNDQKWIEIFHDRVAPNLAKIEINDASAATDLAIGLLKLNYATEAQTIAEQLPYQQKQIYYFNAVELYYQSGNCYKANLALQNIKLSGYSLEPKAFLDYVKSYCLFKLKNSDELYTKLSDQLQNPLLNSKYKLQLLILQAEYKFKQKNQLEAERLLDQATKFSQDDKSTVEIEIVRADFTISKFKKSPKNLSTDDKANINQAINSYSKNLELKEPINPEITYLKRGWLYGLIGEKSAAENDLSTFTSLLEKKILSDNGIMQQLNDNQDLLNAAIALSTKNKEPLTILTWQYDFNNNQCSKVLAESKKIEFTKKGDFEARANIIIADCYFLQKNYKQAAFNLQNLSLSQLSQFEMLHKYLAALILTNDSQNIKLLTDYLNSQNNSTSYLLTADYLKAQAKWLAIVNLLKLPKLGDWSDTDKIKWLINEQLALTKLNKNKEALALNDAIIKLLPTQKEQALTLIAQWRKNLSFKDEIQLNDQLLKAKKQLSPELDLRSGILFYDKLNQQTNVRKILFPLLKIKEFKDKSLAISIITESYIKEKNLKLATKFLEANINSIPNSDSIKAELYFRLAEINHSLKNVKSAVYYYKKAVELNPNNKQAQDAKERLTKLEIK